MLDRGEGERGGGEGVQAMCDAQFMPMDRHTFGKKRKDKRMSKSARRPSVRPSAITARGSRTHTPRIYINPVD